MKALVKWSVFCTDDRPAAALDLDTRRYFDIADRADLDYGEKLAAYRELADGYFEAEHYGDFCASRLADLDARRPRVGRRRATSTPCSSTPSARRSPRTSTTSSSPTTAACWARGRPTSGCGWRGVIALLLWIPRPGPPRMVRMS